MALNFQPPAQLNLQKQYPDIPSSIDSLFNMYLQSKQLNAQQQGLDINRANFAVQNQGLTPERFNAALSRYQPNAFQPQTAQTPEGPVTIGQSGPAPQQPSESNPDLGVLRGLMAHIEQSRQQGVQGKGLELQKMGADVRVKNAMAGLFESQGGGSNTVDIEGVKFIKTVNPSGAVSYQPIPERQPTQSEFAAGGFADKAQQANSVLGKLDSENFNPGVASMAAQSIAPNFLRSPQFQQFDQAKIQFINAILRRESGAAISASEYEKYGNQYFRQPGDSPETLSQKIKARDLAIKNLRQEGRRVPAQYSEEKKKRITTGGYSGISTDQLLKMAMEQVNGQP